MNDARRRIFRAAAGTALSTALPMPGIVRADSAPITLVVGFPAGGGPDIIARVLAERLKDLLGRQIVVDNRAGASGQLGMSAVRSRPADGSTFAVVMASQMTTLPLIYKNLPYDANRDFVPVVNICRYFLSMVAGPMSGAKSLAEFVAWARAHPQQASYGVPGLGSTSQFVGWLLGQAIGVPLNVVGYKGGPQLTQDVIGSQVAAGINLPSNFAGFHDASRLRTVAVTRATRFPTMPDTPTFTELGYKDCEVEEWIAVFAKAGTPSRSVDEFAAAVRSALNDGKVKDALLQQYYTAAPIDAPGLGEMMAATRARWAGVIQASGFKVEE